MKNIQRKLKFYVSYWGFWILYFAFARIIFLLFNFDKTKELNSIFELCAIFLYGFKIDLSATGYILSIPTLALILNSFFSRYWFPKFILGYTTILIFLISSIVISDASLYEHWTHKLDIFGMFYLNNFEDVAGFIPSSTILINVIFLILLILGSFIFYKKIIHPQIFFHKKELLRIPLIFLLLLAFSIIPIRGGIGLNPLNLSNVHFNNNAFSNHSTINVLWNLVYTFTERHKLYQTFEYITPEKIQPTLDVLYPMEIEDAPKLISQNNPNIILIILESFTAELIHRKHQGKIITPNLNQLIQEGIYFENFYASGDRTDEGLVSLLSGFPAQPVSYIINYQSKTEKLPSITQQLVQLGHQTSFYYGGDINFANMKSFLMQNGMQTIFDQKDFPAKNYNQKWGVHDHFVFEKLFNDVQESQQPFFKVLLSLSSHPPFDVPIHTVFKGNDDASLFANSAHYADQALGDFMKKIKYSEVWENTLVIITADHGAPYLDGLTAAEPRKFKIPLIWLGGVIDEQPKTISKQGSQTDFAKTLLYQLNLDASKFNHSKNILSPSSKSFSFYTFNHGYGYIADSTTVVFNYECDCFYFNEDDTFVDSIGHAYLQKIARDFSNY